MVLRCLWVSLVVLVCLTGFGRADESLVLYLRFDEGTGSTTQDESGNGNDGEVQGEVIWENGKYGNAMAFNGATNYLTAGDSGFTNMGEAGDSYTVEAWIKTSQTGGTTWGAPIIAEKRRQPEWHRAFSIYLNASNSLGVRFETGVANVSVDAAAPAINDDDWHHIAFTRDGAEVRLYVDGNLAETGEITDEDRSAPDQPITVGCRRMNDGTPTHYFEGVVDEFAVFTTALGEAEILQDMSGDLFAVSPSGKLATVWGKVKNQG